MEPVATQDEDPQIAQSRDENLDGFDADNVIRVRNYDAVTLAMAGSFGSVIPGVVEAARFNLVWNTERNGEASISNGGGPLDEYFREMFDGPALGEDRDDKDDGWDQYVEVAEQRREREARLREEWAGTSSELAGVEMNGEEWEGLANDIAPGGKLHKTLIDWYMQRGRTRAEAEKKAADDQEIYKIQSTPPALRTSEEQHKLDQANTDPEFRQATQMLDEQRTGTNRSNRLERVSQTSERTVSVSERADALNADAPASASVDSASVDIRHHLSAFSDDSGFPSAPDLVAHHQAAVAATVPLDAKGPALQIAAASAPTTPPPGGGFDA